MNRVAFVMVNHNGGDEVLQSLLSLKADLSDSDIIILVDNASEDNSADFAVEKVEGIHLIKNKSNLTFAEANNIGIRWALDKEYTYIGIINPDVRIQSGMTDILVHSLADQSSSGLGAVSPVMLFEAPAGTIWFAGGKIFWLLAWISHRGLGKPVSDAVKYTQRTDYLTGCCWLANAFTWKVVGPLSTRYGMYAEDVDWSWRARRKNFNLKVIPEALLIHRLSQSSGGGRSSFKMKYRTLANRLFFRMYTNRFIRPAQKIFSIVIIVLYSIFLFLKGENAAIKVYLRTSFTPLGDRVPWPPQD